MGCFVLKQALRQTVPEHHTPGIHIESAPFTICRERVTIYVIRQGDKSVVLAGEIT